MRLNYKHVYLLYLNGIKIDIKVYLTMSLIFINNDTDTKLDTLFILQLTDICNQSSVISNKVIKLVENTFNIIHTSFYFIKHYLSKHSNSLIVGPISSFDSVFNSTTQQLLNSHLKINNIQAHIKYFEKFRLIINQKEKDPMMEQIYSLDKLLDLSKNKETNSLKLSTVYYNYKVDLNNLTEESKTIMNTFGISFDGQEYNYYKNMFKQANYIPNIVELFDLCQSNSEHSRHWFFGGKYVDNSNRLDPGDTSLFKMVKNTLQNKGNSLVAFSDNSSVIKGYNINNYYIDSNNEFKLCKKQTNCVLTAETHNFPTLICPFEGASTGIGGRIRDNQATGIGARLGQSMAGYCVGDINRKEPLYDTPYILPSDMLIEASNGAADYANKIGEPITGGFTRSIYGAKNQFGKHYEYLKPIMFSAGIGSIFESNTFKLSPKDGDLVIRIGGPAYKIGLGGGFQSSQDNEATVKQLDLNAVQRGDPQMENKLNRVVESLLSLTPNPIKSIHDQGAGGLANVVKEIVYPLGADINLNKVTLGDKSLDALEIWCSEFQESNVILIHPGDIVIIKDICDKENINCDNLGSISANNNGFINVRFNDEVIVSFDLEKVLNPSIQKTYELERFATDSNFNEEIECNRNVNSSNVNSSNVNSSNLNSNDESNSFKNSLVKVLGHLDVCSKRFLTTKSDRSVTGLVVQQQCVGPYNVPVANYNTNAFSYFTDKGTTSAIGERPYLGLYSEKHQAEYSIAELISNICGSYIGSLHNIKCSVNWMWPNNSKGESLKLYNTAKHLTTIMTNIGLSIDGGKDSLSMMVNTDTEPVISPGNVVITGYAPCIDLSKNVTPNLKKMNSNLILLSFSPEFDYSSKELKLDGSIFNRTNSNRHTSLPNLLDFKYITKLFDFIQGLIMRDLVLSLHDISDGGLITTIFEMAYSGYKGVSINIKLKNSIQFYNLMFSEFPGVIIEIDNDNMEYFNDLIEQLNICSIQIGKTTPLLSINIDSEFDSDKFYTSISLLDLMNAYETTATQLELKQCNPISVNNEMEFLSARYSLDCFIEDPMKLNIPDEVLNYCYSDKTSCVHSKYSVLILRDDGSNGDKEMCAYFKIHGFSVFNYNTKMLSKNMSILDNVDGIAFVGGFTYSDIMGGATCWKANIESNVKLNQKILDFIQNSSKFIIGVCNGFQLLIRLGIFGNNISLNKNYSERFESRFIPIRTLNSDNSLFLKNMEGTQFGMWCAHKFGRIHLESTSECRDNYVPILFYSDSNYPLNLNGSANDIAGISSIDGRILGLMPHFERSFINYQCPYISKKYKKINYSPWGFMAENIKKFLDT